ncbi:hypothetical protein FNF29_06282 [Cafeteria roenbergensis]|uniref:Uncharacterized protein n=1 Tax=Cafeteria roenbergensis TaxID=33653 RepID=A0A5A8CB22_CAFRO|nr:hypothetical protein FNF29_06282 [Cafeteria roenbergensis]|eukprot:KAA0148991.1 hypothetical protein FNF29_06282 [Cafeteria roenbergensis]
MAARRGSSGKGRRQASAPRPSSSAHVPVGSCSPGARFVGYARESHGQPLFAVAFLDEEYAAALSDAEPYADESRRGGKGSVAHFATAGGRCITLYQGSEQGFEPIQAYTDEDAGEDFYAVRWTVDVATGAPLIAAAGKRGPIKVLDAARMQAHCVLHGHGDAVNDIRAHPTDPSLILSSSKDESLRLWNLLAKCAVAVFAGERGHESEVLAADFHPLGHCFASAGMDNSVKVWGLDDAAVAGAVAASYEFAESAAVATAAAAGRGGEEQRVLRPFHATLVQFPAYSTDGVHSDYVDSCAFLGNLLVSKSTDSRLLLWCPDVSARLRLLRSLAREARASGAGAHTGAREVDDLLAAADAWHDPDMGPLLAGETGEAAGLAEDDEEIEEGAATVLAELPLPNASLWFVRFAVDSSHTRVAAGNDAGDVFVWEPMGPGAARRVTDEEAADFVAGQVEAASASSGDAGVPPNSRRRSPPSTTPAASETPGASTGTSPSATAESPAAGDDAQSNLSSAESESSDEVDEVAERLAFIAAAPLRPSPGAVMTLGHAKSTKAVRQTAFSPDGRLVVAVCDDATVWCYDTKAPHPGAP